MPSKYKVITYSLHTSTFEKKIVYCTLVCKVLAIDHDYKLDSNGQTEIIF